MDDTSNLVQVLKDERMVVDTINDACRAFAKVLHERLGFDEEEVYKHLSGNDGGMMYDIIMNDVTVPADLTTLVPVGGKFESHDQN